MNGRHARVAIGAPVFDRAEYLEQAIESLLAQSYGDFALVVVDDCSTDATGEIVRRYAALDGRVVYERNPRRLGMVGNWRRAYWAAAERVSGFEYFAFGSDHDVWHPQWLESLVRELDADPELVLAYPVTVAISPDGARVKRSMSRRRWETAGLADPSARLRLVASGIPVRAGNIVYGLFRARALERCGVYPFVVGPDRLLMAELSLLGTFKQVPHELWMRRFWPGARPPQRTRLFGVRPPIHAYLPTGLVHAAMLFRWLVLEGRARPEVGRLRGAHIAGVYARCLGVRGTPGKRKAEPARHKHSRLDGANVWMRRRRRSGRRARQRAVRRGRRLCRKGRALVLGMLLRAWRQVAPHR